MATASATIPAPDPWADLVRDNVRMLKGLRRLRDLDIARSIGVSRSVFNARLNARNDLSVSELCRLAGALGVEPHVLLMPQDDLLRWVIEHPAPVATPPSRSVTRSVTKRGTKKPAWIYAWESEHEPLKLVPVA